jgi:hypothetical protein
VQEKFSAGEICVDGAMGFAEGFTALFLFSNAKKNSYEDMKGLNTASHAYPGISTQEESR